MQASTGRFWIVLLALLVAVSVDIVRSLNGSRNWGQAAPFVSSQHQQQTLRKSLLNQARKEPPEEQRIERQVQQIVPSGSSSNEVELQTQSGTDSQPGTWIPRVHTATAEGDAAAGQGKAPAVEASATAAEGAAAAAEGTASAAEGTAAAAAAGFSAANKQAAVVPSRGHPVLGPASARWAPLVLSSCTDTMPKHYAPCLAGSSNPNDSTVIYGEELIYPDFSLPEPIFLLPQHKDWWREKSPDAAPDRFLVHGSRAFYKGQHGQNILLANVEFKNEPPMDTWTDRSCMSFKVQHRGLLPLANGRAPEWSERAVLANPPDSWSLQHFLDRTAKLLLQTEAWRQEGTHIVSGARPRSSHVADMWSKLLQNNQKAEHGVLFSAPEVVFPCRCPMVHPYYHHRLRELMAIPDPVPLEQRTHVLYLSRNQDTGGNTGRRKVNNEEEVLNAIRNVLKERQKNEELVVFDPVKYPDVASLATYMAANVAAVVGPHGGAWYNAMFWAANDTLLVEFQPTESFGVLVWEEGTLVGRPYVFLPCPSQGPMHNMTVDVALVTQALQQHLGVYNAAVHGPRLEYAWDVEQLTR